MNPLKNMKINESYKKKTRETKNMCTTYRQSSKYEKCMKPMHVEAFKNLFRLIYSSRYYLGGTSCVL